MAAASPPRPNLSLPPRRLLSISNGHGEDLNASEVLRSLRCDYPTADLAALPLVGEGKAYRRLGIPLIHNTRALPSGGFAYIQPATWLDDLQAGLLPQLAAQIGALRRWSRSGDFVFATGDVVVLAAAYLSGLPFAAFLVSTSSYYEGRIRLPWLAQFCLRSPRCRAILTRDRFTAEDMTARGYRHVTFAGYPIMDVLVPTGKDLGVAAGVPTIALLPGSRLPEAHRNLRLQLDLVLEIARTFHPHPVQFCAALVPALADLLHSHSPNALPPGWQLAPSGWLSHASENATVLCLSDAFADILHRCDLAIGMAGTAVEQAVGLGKPVIQIPGAGPQFTYAFAEAQMRLLGTSVRTVGRQPATPQTLREAAQWVKAILTDREYLAACIQNGHDRVGLPGGSAGIARVLAACLWPDLQAPAF